MLDELSYEILDFKQILRLKEVLSYLADFGEAKVEHL